MNPEKESQVVNQKVLCPITGQSLFQIQRLEEDLDGLKRKGLLPIKGGAHLDHFVRQIPMLAAATQLGDAYKVIFPPGTTEKLLQHNTSAYLKGTYMTAVVGPDGKIQAQAGLQSLSYLQAPLIAFVIMSAVTGQYFQNKIDNTMRRISNQIDKLIHIILAEKESDVRSIYHFTQYVIENYDAVKFQDELRLATLINIQRNNIQLFSLQKFYEKNIFFELDKMILTGKEIKSAVLFNSDEIAELKKQIENVSEYLERLQLCIDLYMLGRVLEIRLSSLFDDNYLANFQKTLKQIDESNKVLMNQVVDIHNDIFSVKAVIESKDIAVGEIKKSLRLLTERRGYTSESVSSIHSSIDDMIYINKNGFECLYYNNQLHIMGNNMPKYK